MDNQLIPYEGDFNVDTVWDAIPEGKRWTESLRFKLPADLYEAANTIAKRSELPFGTKIESFGAFAIANAVEDLKNYLDAGHKSVWYSIKRMQQHLSNERYVLTIGDAVEQQIEALKLWSSVHEWGAVLTDLSEWAEMIDEMTAEVWKARTAKTWLTHEGVKELRKIWVNDMPSEVHAKVEEVFVHWERLARL